MMEKELISLVIQSFGRENEYKRAILTILSFYAHNSVRVEQTRVLLFTDQPAYFEKYFEGLPVEFVLMTPEKIKSMRGKIDFLHRMKIALIEEAFALTDGPLLYADSDSFFIADPIPLIPQINEETVFMHLHEYRFAEIDDSLKGSYGETMQAFINLLTQQSFKDASGKDFPVTLNMSSWNAGVMFFHPSHCRFIPDVYSLTDQFYPPTQNHAAEQYAFSTVLQRNVKLLPCEQVIYHYWYRVKKQITDDFLNKQFTSEWLNKTQHQKLTVVKQWTHQLPDLYKRHEWMIQDHAIQAFNENQFGKAYQWTVKALLLKPFGSGTFLKDVFYHTKRRFTSP